MKVVMIYGVSLYDYDGIEMGREYFLDRIERDERAKRVSVHHTDTFEFRLSKNTVWKLNNHAIGSEKKKIKDLKEKVEDLTKKLKSKIELLFHD